MAWHAIGKSARKLPLYAPALPIEGHAALSVAREKGPITALREAGITHMSDLYPGGKYITDDDLDYIQNPTPLFRYTCYRLKCAIRDHYTTFPDEPESLKPLQSLITAPTRKKLISKLYKEVQGETDTRRDRSLERWNSILTPQITDTDWKHICALTGYLTSNNNLRITHFKFLHQVYYSPAKLHKIGLRESDNCRRCG